MICLYLVFALLGIEVELLLFGMVPCDHALFGILFIAITFLSDQQLNLRFIAIVTCYEWHSD